MAYIYKQAHLYNSLVTYIAIQVLIKKILLYVPYSILYFELEGMHNTFAKGGMMKLFYYPYIDLHLASQ